MKRTVRSLIRWITAGLVIIGAGEICLEIAHHMVQAHKHIEPIQTNIWNYIIGAVLIVLGVILFLGAESLAEQLTDEPDEPDDTGDDHPNDPDDQTNK